MPQVPDPVERVAPRSLEFADDARQSRLDTFLNMISLDNWSVNNSSMRDYSRRANIHGTPRGLLDVVGERIGFSGENIGLDLAAGKRAQALQDMLESGMLGKALATNQHDRRPLRVIRNPQLDHISGSLIRRRTWEKIARWQGDHAPEGFAIVMHRPMGGLQDLSSEVYRGAAHALFDMVRPGGLMFTQVPRRVVNVPHELEELSESVGGRPDVEEVITTAPRSPRWKLPRDESDLYAVVLKQ